MSETRTCPTCGMEIAAGAPEGLCPRCLVNEALDGDDPIVAPGDRLRYVGDYELLQEIGRGGMGVVYKARQVSLERIVAVKLVLFGPHASESRLERFRREARTLARLSHPSVVAVHEVGEHEGQPYFAMDYVAGRNLAEIVADGPLEPKRAVGYVEALAGALSFAHAQGVLHRDIKPSNVLVDEDDEIRITDFGLAKRLGEDAPLTLTGALLGTPEYMAPEQIEGEERGPETDVYAMGALLYELLTGRPPLRGSGALDTARRVVDQEPVPPSSLEPRVPRDLEAICLKCLEKDPERRYRSARDLGDELRRFLDGLPVEVRPAAPAERLWRTVRRRPWRAATVLVFVLFLALAFSDLRRRQRALVDAARSERLAGNRAGALEKLRSAARWPGAGRLREEAISTVAAPGAELLRSLPFGSAKDLTFSPDGRWVAVTGRWMDGGTASPDSDVVVWETATGRETAHFTAGAEDRVSFGPQGPVLVSDSPPRRHARKTVASGIVAASADGRVAVRGRGFAEAAVVLDVGRQIEIGVLPFPVDTPRQVVLSPDGRYIAATDRLPCPAPGGAVRIWNVTAGSPPELHPLPSPPAAPNLSICLWEATFQPGGSILATVGAEAHAGMVVLWDVESGREVARLREGQHRPTWSADGRLLGTLGGGEISTGDHSTMSTTLRIDGIETGNTVANVWNVTPGVASYLFDEPVRRLSFNAAGSTLATDTTLWDWTTTPLGPRLARKVTETGDGDDDFFFDRSGALWTVSPPYLGQANFMVLMRTTPPQRAVLLRSPDYSDVELGFRVLSPEPGSVLAPSPRALDLSPDGSLLAMSNDVVIVSPSGGKGGGQTAVLELWDMATGRRKALLEERPNGPPWRGLRFSADGARLAALDGFTVALWDVTSGRRLHEARLRDWSSLISVSDDGRWIAAGGERVEVYAADTGDLRASFRASDGRVTALAVSAQGEYLAAGDDSGRIRLWSLPGGGELARWPAHQGAVTALAFHPQGLPDGPTLVSGGADGLLTLWHLPELREELAELGLGWKTGGP